MTQESGETTTADIPNGSAVGSDARKPAPRWKRWGKEALIFAGLFLLIRLWQGRDLVTGDAPALRATTIDGAPVTLDADEPTVVHFMATWCPACKAMHSNVENVGVDHHVVTVAVQCGQGEALTRGMREAGWLDDAGHSPVPVVADPAGSLARAWGVSSFPTTFVVSGGKIRAAEVGYTSELGIKLRLWWAKLRS